MPRACAECVCVCDRRTSPPWGFAVGRLAALGARCGERELSLSVPPQGVGRANGDRGREARAAPLPHVPCRSPACPRALHASGCCDPCANRGTVGLSAAGPVLGGAGGVVCGNSEGEGRTRRQPCPPALLLGTHTPPLRARRDRPWSPVARPRCIALLLLGGAQAVSKPLLCSALSITPLFLFPLPVSYEPGTRRRLRTLLLASISSRLDRLVWVPLRRPAVGLCRCCACQHPATCEGYPPSLSAGHRVVAHDHGNASWKRSGLMHGELAMGGGSKGAPLHPSGCFVCGLDRIPSSLSAGPSCPTTTQ